MIYKAWESSLSKQATVIESLSSPCKTLLRAGSRDVVRMAGQLTNPGKSAPAGF